MAKVRFNRRVNISRVVKRLVGTVISLWVGGTIMIEVGNTMNGTCSPFYRGLNLIGWEVTTGTCSSTGASNANTIMTTSGTGVLAVVGIIGIAGVVMEFINIGY